ncbi:MAG: DUF4394 domain-containing protein [Alcanivorax sp.]|nr:DUF4394 domain-containing protein [Alcanivorax sp.]
MIRQLNYFLIPALLLLLSACGSSSSNRNQAPDAADMFYLTDNNRLIGVTRSAPTRAVSIRPVSGLMEGEMLLGMAFRPATGDLYALGSGSNLYVVNTDTGMAGPPVALNVMLEGESFGIDFNPVPDRLRVTSNTGQNLRINVETGETIEDGEINGGMLGTTITASAYTNSFAGTGTTQLFNIDSGTGTLYLQNPPNDGTQQNPVTLGIDVEDGNGFVIDGQTNQGLALLTSNGVTGLYSIDINATENAATLMAALGTGIGYLGLAIPPAHPPMVTGLTLDNTLITFSPQNPGMILNEVDITGLTMMPDDVVGIDRRPATGDIYIVTASGRLYTVDPMSGAASFASTLIPAQAPNDGFAGLEIGDVALDFNPTVDRLRLIQSTGQNLRINVDTGEALVDGMINLPEADEEGQPSIAAAAYTNNYGTAMSTLLITVDAANNQFNEQIPPNDGTQVPQAAITPMPSGPQSLDIAGGDNGLALFGLSESQAGTVTLYRLNLMNYGITPIVGGDAAMSRIGGMDGPGLLGFTLFFPEM